MTTTPLRVTGALDFYELRREGIGHLERAGSTHWTDYNSHDPGITILEALSYAITELGWRADFPIEDLLASAATGATTENPYPGQAFPTARTILTVNPTTPTDLRRLLIDVEPVRNAWVRCRDCPCGPGPAVRGLYDVLLELEADPEVGDLNDRKVTRRRTVTGGDGRRRPFTLELRFPELGEARRSDREALATEGDVTLAVTGPFRTTTGTTPIDDAELRTHFNDVLYVDLQVALDGGTVVEVRRAALRLFGSGAVRRQTTVADITSWLGETTAEGFVQPYRRKLALADAAVARAAAVLHAHRPLDEDTCHVEVVGITDIAVCADVHLTPDADVELVQALLWYETGRYLDPPPEFRTLQEMRARGTAVEDIFNGPALRAGFLTDEGLEATDLRRELRISDLLDRLMEIDGILGIDNLLLTAHGPDGAPLAGLADPAWNDGGWTFDPHRTSASWRLFLPPAHRPRLHPALSRFTFEADGLPFAPRQDEAEDTLVELHGRAARPKLQATDLDLPVPLGRHRDLASYHPVTNSLPTTYGIGPAGLPSSASTERRAQALQLKAYLMVYEQLLRNAYAQLASGVQLFSLDPETLRSYFTAALTGISDLGQVMEPAADAAAADLVETPAAFLERRNRFLDHLLARFGESFARHGLLMSDLAGHSRAQHELAGDKAAFLGALPRIGRDRGKAFNRRFVPCHPDNAPGLQQRVNLLLGFPERSFHWHAHRTDTAPGFTHSLDLVEGEDVVATFTPAADVDAALPALLTALALDTSAEDWRLAATHEGIRLTTPGPDGKDHQEEVEPSDEAEALMGALVRTQRRILARLILPDTYRVEPEGAGWRVLLGPAADPLGAAGAPFPGRAEADAFAVGSATWAAHKRAIVVEHLLLRPKFPGDALYPGDDECGPDDAYSFLLTYVLPGWTDPFNTNIALRRFADRTILEQTPSHLVLKACWVGNDGYLPDPCDPVIDAVAALLGDGSEASCQCAAELVAAHGTIFDEWFTDNTLVVDSPAVLAAQLDDLFAARMDWDTIGCAQGLDAGARGRVRERLAQHFADLARRGYQFERFEDAWCRWLEADAAIDWSQEHVLDAVVEILEGFADATLTQKQLCACAEAMVTVFGGHFAQWRDDNVAAGRRWEDFSDFAAPDPAGCDGLPSEAAEAVGEFLRERYSRWREVSYRLHVLVGALAALRNTYPRATLHDCDDGSDANPVRLGQTVLGSN